MTDKYQGHTPGPWEVLPTNKCFVYKSDENIAATNFRDIAATHSGKTAETNYANARLIAAAPDLLVENKRLRKALQAVKSLALEDMDVTQMLDCDINATISPKAVSIINKALLDVSEVKK